MADHSISKKQHFRIDTDQTTNFEKYRAWIDTKYEPGSGFTH